MISSDEVIRFCQANNRICPQPAKWNDLFRKLPNVTQEGAGFNPPAPLILAGWWASSDEQKKERLAIHIRWAERHGVLISISNFLSSLSEQDWYHVGE